jgi:hypothetical protein
MKAICGLCTIAALAASPAFPQVSGHTVREDSGPLRELSRNVEAGSGPVYDPGRSISAGNAGPLSGNVVADSTTGDVTSGPWSDVSRGAVTAHQPVSGGGTPTDASVGAVTRDANVPLRASLPLPPPEPVYDLRPLREQLRAIEPLPREATAEPQAPEDGAPSDAVAQNDQPEVHQVEPPDARDSTTVNQPEEPQANPPAVGQPPEPPVESPPESVEIPMPGHAVPQEGQD